MGFVSLGCVISHVIFNFPLRSVESEQTSREKQALHACL